MRSCCFFILISTVACVKLPKEEKVKDKLELEGDKYLQQSDYRNALTSYLKLIKKDEENPAVLNKISISYFYAGVYEKALYYIYEAIRMDESNAVYYYNKACVHNKLGQYNYAIIDISYLIMQAHNDPFLYSLRAELQVKNGNEKEAIQDFEKAIALNTNDAVSWFYYGILLQNQNLAKQGREALEIAYELDPSFKGSSPELGDIEINIEPSVE